jgi:hypothetical protein
VDAGQEHPIHMDDERRVQLLQGGAVLLQHKAEELAGVVRDQNQLEAAVSGEGEPSRCAPLTVAKTSGSG